MKLKSQLSYRALKYGIPIKDLSQSFSSFKWIFNRVYLKNRVFSQFDYSLKSNHYLVLSNNVLLFKSLNLLNSLDNFLKASVFIRSILFIYLLKQEKLLYLLFFSKKKCSLI